LERLDIDRFELCRRRMQFEMHAGQVEHRIDAIEGGREPARLADVLHPKIELASLGAAVGPRRRMHVDGPDLEAAGRQIGREMRPDEAGRAGDEYPPHHLRADTATAYPPRPGINLSKREKRYMKG